MCCVFISLSIITTLNSTHARQQSPCSAVYSRPLTLCTRLTPTTRCAHNTRHTQEHVSSSSNRRFCQRRRRHHDSARSPPSPHFSLSSTGAAEGSGFHSRRASRRARITQHTHPHECGKKTPSKQHSTCCKHPAAAAAAATAAHLTAHTKPRLSSTGTYLIVSVTSRRRVDHLRHARAQSEARLLRLG